MAILNLVKRLIKGSPLTYVEGDNNLTDIENELNTPNDGKTYGRKNSNLEQLSDVATSGNYNDLTNKPTKTSDFLNDSGFITAGAIPSIPTKTSEITNDSGFITAGAIPSPQTLSITGNDLSISGGNTVTLPSGGGLESAGNITNVTFEKSKYYGNISSAVSGNITYNLTGAVSGAKAIIFHQDSTEPILPIKTFKKNSTDYVISSINVITLTFINNDCILCEMHNLMSASIEPELMVWLNKGGVASGFVLKAMNDFLMEIKPMRSRILRMNVMFGETFASMFIPLIINIDGSNVPLAGSLSYDTNVGYISSDWIMSGATAGLTVASTTKSISSNFSPLNVAEFGLDDASFGMFYNASGLAGVPHNSRAVIGGNIDLYMYSSNYPAYTGIQLNGSKITTSQLSSGFPLIVNRSSNSSVDLYISGVKTTYSNASTAKTADVPSFGLPYIQGNATVQLIGGYFIGKSLTDIQAALLRSAWVTLHTKLNHKVS